MTDISNSICDLISFSINMTNVVDVERLEKLNDVFSNVTNMGDESFNRLDG